MCVVEDGVNTAEKQYRPAAAGVTGVEVPVEWGGVAVVVFARVGLPTLVPVVVEQEAAVVVGEAVKHS